MRNNELVIFDYIATSCLVRDFQSVTVNERSSAQHFLSHRFSLHVRYNVLDVFYASIITKKNIYKIISNELWELGVTARKLNKGKYIASCQSKTPE